MYKSKRISLRAFTEDDAKYISEIKNDFTALKAFAGHPFPSNLISEKEWISNMYPPGLLSTIYFVIEENETNSFVGYAVARKIDYINSNADVGIIFHEKARGKGFFKEASILFYRYLFSEINLHKVYSFVLTYNEIAIENDKKIGFKVEGIMKDQIFQGGKYHDVYMISLYASEFYKLHLK